MDFFVGTSSFGYKEWKGKFYPKDLPASKVISYYSEHFNAVEINSTFYSLPKKEVFESWKEQAPANFNFVLKAPQLITHKKRLKDIASDVETFLEVSAKLKEKRKVIFFQLPPNFKVDFERFKDLIKLLPKSIKASFEFRHQSWFNDEVYDILKKRNFALCLADTDEEPIEEIISTADWGYVRLRKANYTKKNLADWHKKISSQSWKEAFVFFKHEETGTGPKFAKMFMEL